MNNNCISGRYRNRFKISAPKTATSGTPIPVEVTVYGNLELELEPMIRLYYQTVNPTSDLTQMKSLNEGFLGSGEPVVFEIPGHDAGTTIYYWVVIHVRTTPWKFNGKTPVLIYPGFPLTEKPL